KYHTSQNGSAKKRKVATGWQRGGNGELKSKSIKIVKIAASHQLVDYFACIQHLHRPAIGGVVILERIDAQQIIDGGGSVLRRDAPLGRQAADFVGGADHLPAANAGAGEQHREDAGPMNTAGAL